MDDKREKSIKGEIINIGRSLHSLGLVSGCAGNLSARLDADIILITATGKCLGNLKYSDIIRVNIKDEIGKVNKRVSSEFPLHSLIYKNFPVNRIIHCHPPLTNAYFAIYSCLKELTLEAKFYLGKVPVIKQNSPTVKRPMDVIKALKNSRLAILKNHGVVVIGDEFAHNLNLIQTLETAVKVAAVARLFKKDLLDCLDRELKKDLNK